jgi:ERCC4-related helicase
VKTRLLIGSDNVDRWSDTRIWDAALKDIRVVVSTHAVLADALSHGFVNIQKLSLVVFDEGIPTHIYFEHFADIHSSSLFEEAPSK